MPTPRFAELRPDTRAAVLNKTRLDVKLYSALEERWARVLAMQDDSFHEEVATLRELRQELETVCGTHPTHPACVWYRLEDVHFFALVDARGYARAVEFTHDLKQA